jgi:cytidyltransferase-like protein
MIIQIIGLPGTGKTALAAMLASRINAIHFNADDVRSDLSKDLGFSAEDRIEQARRLGALARLTSKQGYITVVDFVCPTDETRTAFGKPDILIWVDRIKESRFTDTNNMWQDPNTGLRIINGLTVEQEVDLVISAFNLYDWRKPTTLMLGRYQPWHEGHQALLEKAYERTEQVVVGVRDTQGTSEKDPLSYQVVAERIRTQAGPSFVVKFPNITNIVYGRDVGYKIEQIDLGAEIHSISATQKRKELGI